MAATVSDEGARTLARHNDYLNREAGVGPSWIYPNSHKEIAQRHAAKARNSAKARNPWTARNNTRVIEFQKIFQHRYHGHMPDDDAGCSDLALAIRHIIATESEQNARRFAESWAPWCVGERFDEIAEEIGPDPKPQKAWPLGKELCLTYALRKHLKIRTIGPCDVTQRQFTLLKKAEDAERKRRKRLSKGGMSRETYESSSKTKTEPWKAMDWSKSTYQRRVRKLGQAAGDALIADAVAKSDTTLSGINLRSIHRTNLCHLTDAAQRLRGIMPDQNVLDDSSPAGGNMQSGEAANDNSPSPAILEAQAAA